jgi:hypothetical protein
MSFHLSSIQDVYRADHLMGKHDIPVEAGPTRYGITRDASAFLKW